MFAFAFAFTWSEHSFGFVCIAEKTTSLLDGFIENPMYCSHSAATKVKEKMRFCSVHSNVTAATTPE